MAKRVVIRNPPSLVPRPLGVEPALARIVEALARQAARDDYASRNGGDNDDEKSGDIRPLLQRPPDRQVD